MLDSKPALGPGAPQRRPASRGDPGLTEPDCPPFLLKFVEWPGLLGGVEGGIRGKSQDAPHPTSWPSPGLPALLCALGTGWLSESRLSLCGLTDGRTAGRTDCRTALEAGTQAAVCPAGQEQGAGWGTGSRPEREHLPEGGPAREGLLRVRGVWQGAMGLRVARGPQSLGGSQQHGWGQGGGREAPAGSLTGRKCRWGAAAQSRYTWRPRPSLRPPSPSPLSQVARRRKWPRGARGGGLGKEGAPGGEKDAGERRGGQGSRGHGGRGVAGEWEQGFWGREGSTGGREGRKQGAGQRGCGGEGRPGKEGDQGRGPWVCQKKD